jgi:glycosyltransferase involved in cell wall biosynthesis
MAKKPLVSTIIPYYDAPEFFREALSSIQQQTYKNYEVVVVDDASPGPPAAEIVDEFAFPCIKVIRHDTNTGPQTARNTAVANSAGDYILPFDCDDKLHPEYISETVRALEDEQFAGAYTQIAFFGEKTDLWTPQPTLIGVMSGSSSGPNTFLYRRQVYDAVGGYNTQVYCSDASLWLAALAHGFKFTLIERPLLNYRVRSNGRLARLPKHEHVPSLAAAYPELYSSHMIELLRFQEERYHSLLNGYHQVVDGYERLLAEREALNLRIRELESRMN